MGSGCGVFIPRTLRYKFTTLLVVLFHDDISQRVSKSVILLVQNKRRTRFVVFATCRHLKRENDRVTEVAPTYVNEVGILKLLQIQEVIHNNNPEITTVKNLTY